MITREQVADLREGDVVELFVAEESLTVRGPIMSTGPRGFMVGGWPIKQRSPGDTLTVISAPRPLYVNHPRTEPVPGDVVRDADEPEWNGWLYLRSDNGRWLDSTRGEWFEKAMPTRLRLLVDGETGDTVPAVQS